LTSQADNVTIHIKYRDIEKTFSGSMEEAWLCVNRFFSELIPSFEIASKLMLKADLQKLVMGCEGIVAFSKEGSNLLVSRNKLTDNETLTLWLLADYIGFQLGLMGSDAVSKEELQAKLGKSSKIASTRLGELVKNGIIAKTADEKYSITTLGIVQTQKNILTKIKAKTGT
jgi:hypothetical protein